MTQQDTSLVSGGIVTAVLAIAPGFNPAAKVVPASTAPSTTAIALTQKAQVSILVEYFLASLIATQYGGNTGRSLALINQIRGRIYREGTSTAAKIFNIAWSATRYDSGSIGTEATVTVLVDGKSQSVRVVPQFETGISFKRIKTEGDRMVSAGSFHCILLRPEENRRDQDRWTAVEIGLARASDIEEFNKVSQADPIALLQHSILKLGQRRMTWMPTMAKTRNFGKGRGGKAKEKDLLGYIGWKMVFLAEHSEYPDYKKGKKGEDGKFANEGFLPSVFSIEEGRASITVSYLGKAGKVALDDGNIPEFSSVPNFDPWAVLGRSPSRLDWNLLQDVQRRIMASLLHPENPAVAYARALGIVREGATLEQIQTTVGPMVTTAVEKAKEDLKRAWSALAANVDTVSTSLTLGEILDGKEAKVVRKRRGGEDLAAKNVEAAIGSPFDWECPMHRDLRTRLIDALEAKEPKPEPVAAVANPETPPTEGQPADGAPVGESGEKEGATA